MTRRLAFYITGAATEHYLGMHWPRDIWQAVLEQAIRDAVAGPEAFELHGPPEEQNAQREAYREAAQFWIDDDVDEPRRFRWVCEQLGLEPTAVRREVRAGKERAEKRRRGKK